MRLPVAIKRPGYRIAYRILQVYWLVFSPDVSGVKCVLTDGDSLLMVRHTYGDRSWDLPGGTLKRGEDPADAARREMAEELGIEIGEWGLIGKLELDLQGRHEHLHCFRAEIGTAPLTPDGGELAAVSWFPRGELPATLARYVRPVIDRVWAE